MKKKDSLSSGANSGGLSKGRGKFTIIIGDEGAILVLMKGKKVARRFFVQDASAEKVASFINMMEEHPNYPVSILLDVIDQSYTRHTLPPVSPIGVKQLVQRRLDRDFAKEDLKGFIPLGRDKEGRKDWNFLLISVPQSELLKSWLDMVLELPNMFEGVYLSPVEGQNYIQSIHKALPALPNGTPRWQMLVSHNKVSGYRQIVLKDGKLFFARVAQATDGEPAAVSAGNIEQEIMNTVEYLRRMGLDEEASFELFVLSAQDIIDVIDASRFDSVRTELFTPPSLAQLLKLEHSAVSGDRFGDILMAASHANISKQSLKLKIPYAERIKRFYLLKIAARAASILFLIGSLGYVGLNVKSAMEFSNEFGQLKDKETQKREELNRLEKIASELPADAKKISDIVTVWRTVSDDSVEGVQEVKDNVYKLKRADVNILGFTWQVQRKFDGEEISSPRTSFDQNGSQDSTVTPPSIIKVDIEFLLSNTSEQIFLQRAEEYLGFAKSALPDYEVKYEKLLSESSDEKKSLELNFDDLQTGQALMDKALLNVKLILFKKDLTAS